MSAYTRRAFLKQVVLSAGAITVGEFVYPMTTLANEKFQTVFWKGVVVRVDSDTIAIWGSGLTVSGISSTLLNSGNEAVLIVHVNSDTSIWKGKNIDLSVIEKDDHVYGQGLSMEDGTILCTRMWVNLAQFRGVVVEKAPGLIKLEDTKQGNLVKRTIVYDQHTLINDGHSNIDAIQLSRYIQALGVMQRTGQLKATRIWA